MDSIDYRDGFSAEEFLALANLVWPRDYDLDRTREALARTTSIGAWDGRRLIGTVRISVMGIS